MVYAGLGGTSLTNHDSIVLDLKFQHRFFITTATPKTRHGCPDYFVLYGIGDKTCALSFTGLPSGSETAVGFVGNGGQRLCALL
jgi:hypothetical protein